MRLWTIPFRLLGILALAVLISGAWLLRHEIIGFIQPQVDHVTGAFDRRGTPPTASAAARDKIDSLLGWGADSVVLTAGEMGAVMLDALPAQARHHIDSVRVTLGDGRVILDARLEASQIPPELLGPLAGVLNPWEMVTISGDLAAPRPRFAEWRVDALTLRGITLPAEASQKLIERGLPGADGGRIQFALPKGVASLTVRAAGATLYREQVE